MNIYKWQYICDFYWNCGNPAIDNKIEMQKLPYWLRKYLTRVRFISDDKNTIRFKYINCRHCVYKLHWQPSDCIDHLTIYRANRINKYKHNKHKYHKVERFSFWSLIPHIKIPFGWYSGGR